MEAMACLAAAAGIIDVNKSRNQVVPGANWEVDWQVGCGKNDFIISLANGKFSITDTKSGRFCLHKGSKRAAD